ncbi:ATP-binding protein [Puniceicoccaceae bacterium K14]|nr:ATP-binding protein [Puniceicoccaceae bacterium K14]
MEYLFLIAFFATTLVFATKYFRQKEAIKQLSESLVTRTSILTHSKEFRGNNKHWSSLLGELNQIISDFQKLERQSTGRLNQIDTTFSNLQEGVLIIDRDNYVLMANTALGSLFPSVGSGVGKRVEVCLRSSDFLKFIRDVKRGEGELRKELSFSKGQQQVWMEVSASKLTQAEEGNGPWFLFVLHDISQLMRLEQVRKNFVANASHELKTPVAIIKGYSETLVSDHHTMEIEDRDRFLNTIHRHAERLSLLINDLLSLSRLESEAPTLEWSHSNIIGWLREISADYELNLKGEDRCFFATLPENMEAWVRFDVLKLRQVFDNLVENANKYTPKEGCIELGAVVAGEELHIWVKDEGPGVPEADLLQIFERFYRVDKGRSRETGGTGLGLSIVKHIIEWHEGKIWAENAETGGLRIVFSLPIVEQLTNVSTAELV